MNNIIIFLIIIIHHLSNPALFSTDNIITNLWKLLPKGKKQGSPRKAFQYSFSNNIENSDDACHFHGDRNCVVVWMRTRGKA